MHLATLDTTATEARALPASAVPIASPTLTDIAVVGLDYVGLPLSLQFARCGVNVLGLDVDPEKVNALNEGRSYIKHVSPESVADQVKANRLEAATDFSRVDEVDAVIICVPTPLNKNREPDIAYILQTGRAVAPHLRKGTLVVLESTTYPGTTDEDLRAVLETESGRKAGVDFHLAATVLGWPPSQRLKAFGRK
jgi:UDP-N-acetyl-D-glucosamine dehydrogenase